MNKITSKNARQSKTETELRGWYSRAAAGTLMPPMGSEDWEELAEAHEIMCRSYPPKD